MLAKYIIRSASYSDRLRNQVPSASQTPSLGPLESRVAMEGKLNALLPHKKFGLGFVSFPTSLYRAKDSSEEINKS
jgi:hypothetical protein